MLPSTTIVIRGYIYDIVLTSGIYFKAFLECQMSKDKPDPFFNIPFSSKIYLEALFFKKK